MILSTLAAHAFAIALQAQVATAGETPTSDSPKVMWRWTDYRGQINYGDRPPANAQNLLRIDLLTIGEHTQSLLPYQVRRAASNFPVMLFTARNCPPCATAREFLNKRGVPFAERTIETGDDATELKRLTGAEGVPVLTLGAQPLLAFSPEDWHNGLDATGYPRTSMLPPSFKQEPARPLTAKAAPPAAVAAK
jgi:glutaredoxin